MGRHAVTPTNDWPARFQRISTSYPTVTDPRFDQHLSQPGFMGLILRDILRLHVPSTHGGPIRTTPDVEVGVLALREILGGAYNCDEFPKAINILTRGHSNTQIARKSGLSKSSIQRLRSGAVAPSPQEMERIARAYDREPEWFAAYRAHLLASLVAAEAHRNPERSAITVRKIKQP